jgi:putative transposase
MMATVSHYAETDFLLHAFVIMPDHVHLLITPSETVERAIQLIKGGFSFRAKRELNWKGDIWQQGFTDHRIRDEEDWNKHLDYIRRNPVRAHLAEDSMLYPYIDFTSPSFPQGLKPLSIAAVDVRAEARTLQAQVAARAEARGLQVSAFEVNKKSIEEALKNNATQK